MAVEMFLQHGGNLSPNPSIKSAMGQIGDEVIS
jgi:hypothetical protein